jgi:hypothetical protein
MNTIPQPSPPDHQSQPPQPVPQPNGAWICSVCGGYVRSDATFCKHCHVPFQNDVDRTAMRAGTAHEWMSLLAVVTAGIVGWLSGRLLPGLYGVALGWTVGATVIWLAVCWSRSVRALHREGKVSLWVLLPSIWLFLLSSIVLPAVLGTWMTEVAHWPGFTLGLSIASTLFLLVALTTMRANRTIASTLLGDYADVHNWDSWPALRKTWLELHLIGIVPLMLVEWIRFSLGALIGGVAQVLWFVWMFYGSKRVIAWMKQHRTWQE